MWKAGWWRGKDRQTEEKDIDNAKLTTEYWLNVAEFRPASLGAASYSSKASISLWKGEPIVLIRHHKDEDEDESEKNNEEREDYKEDLRKDHEEIGYDKVFDGISEPAR
ncbi:hypothetical protein MJO28_005384 [Puccinia striiformis f. sp. tritici]|uniref:Uncharacterized protein n=1 Tax=Puccinia striiformis f. sp. tritici TaxID=168172 RepID=A0ACC0ELK1_9BASI|nr:hypothetical protein MJO28_005384 [Puccinia striiformis f. sp. tritici]KAI9630248.1 hypothetical protein KEM48_014174 [Puccinia striiformis f. sp. tritici PST-130]